jgi:hypothetical protein
MGAPGSVAYEIVFDPHVLVAIILIAVVLVVLLAMIAIPISGSSPGRKERK